MAVLEMVKPVIEWIGPWTRVWAGPPIALGPDHEDYDEWAAAISEGWCPPDAPDGKQHRLEPFVDPQTGEQWLSCGHDTWFRLVYPNQLEEE